MNLPSSCASDASDIVDGVFDWLLPRLPRAGTPLEVAVALNQAPFLIAWATARRFGPSRGASTPRTALLERALREREFFPRLGAGGEDVAAEDAPVRHAPGLLAVCLQPNSTRALLPVARHLRHRGVVVRFLVDYMDARSRRAVAEEGFACSRTPPAVSVESLASFAPGYLRLRSLWTDQHALAGLLRTLRLESESPRSLSRQLRLETLRTLLRGAAIETALRGIAASNVLFVTHRGLLDHLLGATHPTARKFLFLQGIVPDIPPIRTALSVHHAVVGSSLDVPYARRCGIDPDRLTISGSPESDHYPSLRKDVCRGEFDRRHPAASKRPLIVFTSQYPTPMFSDAARLEHLRMLVDCAQQTPEAFFAVKLHPVREVWQVDSLPDNLVILKNADTARLIKAADALVTYWSTTMLEAVLLGTPVIQLNATGLPDFFDLSARLGRPIVRTLDDLVSRLRRTLDGSDAHDADAERARIGVTVDGRAAERAATAIFTRLRS